MPKVAVEEGLSQIEDILSRNGFEVVGVKSTRLRDVDAIVVSGLDVDIMGDESTLTKAPVVEVYGRSAEEVLRDLRERIKRK